MTEPQEGRSRDPRVSPWTRITWRCGVITVGPPSESETRHPCVKPQASRGCCWGIAPPSLTPVVSESQAPQEGREEAHIYQVCSQHGENQLTPIIHCSSHPPRGTTVLPVWTRTLRLGDLAVGPGEDSSTVTISQDSPCSLELGWSNPFQINTLLKNLHEETVSCPG